MNLYAMLYQLSDGTLEHSERCKSVECAVKLINPLTDGGKTLLGHAVLYPNPSSALMWLHKQTHEVESIRVAPQRAPARMVLVPVPVTPYRGYAKLGTGAYLLNHSKAGEPAELVISIATDAEKAGRTVGDERYNPEGTLIDPEKMAVRLEFVSVAGLDALEQQLRHLRSVHFAAATPLPLSVESLIAELRIIEGVRLAIGGTQEIADDYRERCATFLHLNYAALVQALSNQPSEVNEDAERFRWFAAAMIERDGSKRAALKAQRFPHDLDGYRRSIDAARAAQPEGRTDG